MYRYAQHSIAQSLVALDLSLALVKGNVAFDLVHAFQGLGIVPGGVLDFSLVGRHRVVLCVALVGAVCRGRGRTEVGLFDGIRGELRAC